MTTSTSKATFVLNTLRRIMRYIDENPENIYISDVIKNCCVAHSNALEYLSFLVSINYVRKHKINRPIRSSSKWFSNSCWVYTKIKNG